MITTDSLRGRLALMAAHCAGMVDLVALPLWVGILMSHYRFDPQQAGGVVTLFLVGAVVAETVRLAESIGALAGRIRAAHLLTHVRQQAMLSPQQVASYQRLRGYGD